MCGVSFNDILLEKEVQLRFAQLFQLEEVQLSWGTTVGIDIVPCLPLVIAALATAQLSTPALQ